MRRFGPLALLVIGALVFAGCRDSGNASGSAPLIPESTSGGATASSTAPPTAGIDLATKVIPAPKGYELSTASDSMNGPTSPAMFDKTVGLVGSAASYGYVTGYEHDYDATASNDSVYVNLFAFSSPAQAAAFQPTAATITNAYNEGPARTDYGAIPGAFAVDGTMADKNGRHDHAIVAYKGTVVMIVDVATEAAGPVPTSLAALAADQYRRL